MLQVYVHLISCLGEKITTNEFVAPMAPSKAMAKSFMKPGLEATFLHRRKRRLAVATTAQVALSNQYLPFGLKLQGNLNSGQRMDNKFSLFRTREPIHSKGGKETYAT